jgi:NAD(P)-dependent dehydrogenase (short-subunit alcohol dehydrogenase family)
MIAVNVTGTFFLTQQVARHMIAAGRQGSIVNIASTHALVGAPERSTYGIAKAATVQMTRMPAVEWATHGIRVNAIAPGRMETASPSRAEKGKGAADTYRSHYACSNSALPTIAVVASRSLASASASPADAFAPHNDFLAAFARAQSKHPSAALFDRSLSDAGVVDRHCDLYQSWTALA